MTETSNLVQALASADAAYQEAADAVETVGEPRLRLLGDTLEEFQGFLGRYREPASGTGRETFQSYIEFEAKLDDFIKDLPENLPAREAFETAAEHLDKRRLSPADFDIALEELEPAVDRLAIRSDRASALDDYRHARHAVEQARRDLDTQIRQIEQKLAFKDVDFALSTDPLQTPIDTYNSTVTEAFNTFLETTSARTVIRFLEKTTAYPLVQFEQPPTRLREFIMTNDAGTEPLPTLLSYTDYTRSKLAHYVDDPGTFNAHIATNRSYLERLSSTPLIIEWPPPPASRLRWRIRELIPVVSRFAPAETVESLRSIRSLAQDPRRYAELRRIATANETLTDEDRKHLQASTMETEHDRLHSQREVLIDALSEYPER